MLVSCNLSFKLLTKSTKEGIQTLANPEEYSYNDNKNKDFSSRIDNSKPLKCVVTYLYPYCSYKQKTVLIISNYI